MDILRHKPDDGSSATQPRFLATHSVSESITLTLIRAANFKPSPYSRYLIPNTCAFMASILPSSRLILTDLILQLSELSKSNSSSPPKPNATDESAARNPLKALPKEAREIIVALEYLIPSGVTSALDVLDKGLVTRYTLKTEEKTKEKVEASAAEPEIPGTPTGSGSEISDIREEVESADLPAPTRSEKYSYYVESEKIPRSRFSKKPPLSSPTHQVLLAAWYCTCPKFFNALVSKPGPVATNAYPEVTDRNRKAKRKWEAREFEKVWDLLKTHNWVWGGRMLGVHAPPICKHLLACVLAENCGDLFMPFVKRVELDIDEMVGMSVNILRL